jgi:hypothetical protein
MIKIETWKVEKKHRVAREKIKEKYMLVQAKDLGCCTVLF